MNSLKTLLIAGLLAALSYAVYVGLTGNADRDQPDDPAVAWQSPPLVDPGTMVSGAPPVGAPTTSGSATHQHPTGPAPAYTAAQAPGAAPPFAGGQDQNQGLPGSAATAPPLVARSVPPGTESTGLVEDTPPVADLTPATSDSRYPDYPAADNSANEPSAAAEAESTSFADALQEAQSQLNAGQLADAHYALSQWWGDVRLTPAEDAQLMQLLNGVAGTVVYSRQHWLEPAHRVQSGESLQQIAERYSVPWQLLARINGVRDPNVLPAGEELKVLRGPFDALVSLDSRQLTLVIDGRYAGQFRIGLGRDQPNPEGRYNVIAKNQLAPHEGLHQHVGDSPSDLRLDLGNDVSIHGAHDPTMLDRDDQPGCIRLAPRDIDDVYHILSVGSNVIIQR